MKLARLLALLICLPALAVGMQPPAGRVLLNAVTVTGTGQAFGLATPVINAYDSSQADQYEHACMASITGTTPTATVNLEVTNNPSIGWVVAATLTLGAGNLIVGQTLTAPWRYVRGNVTAIAGTSAAVTLSCSP